MARQLTPQASTQSNGANNKLRPEDRAVHDWYRFVLSFPPHLVRDYADRFALNSASVVLDPFCGTGTTLVECKKAGIPSVGIEANPMPCFASAVKVDWEVDPDALLADAHELATAASKRLSADGIRDFQDLPLFSGDEGQSVNLRSLDPEAAKLLLKNSISPLPLHKALVLLETLEAETNGRFRSHERVAFAKALVFSVSNLHFGPEVGVRAPKADAPVIEAWLAAVHAMADDLKLVRAHAKTSATVHNADSRELNGLLEPESIDAVITSPPYPNEKDYTRTTRLESVLLGFIQSKKQLRSLKQGLLRSNTRNAYKADDDDLAVADNGEIQEIAEAIEKRRIELGKTSGWERLYARVTKLYFGGMKRHLADMRTCLKPGARLAYVVGDQASYLQVMIRTGRLLADIAESLGYEVTSLDLFRTRLATATKQQLREEVLVLRWPGPAASSR